MSDELKEYAIFNHQFYNDVLKEAKIDTEQQIIMNAFDKFPDSHTEFSFRLMDLDWFLEKYECIFQMSKDSLMKDLTGPTRKKIKRSLSFVNNSSCFDLNENLPNVTFSDFQSQAMPPPKLSFRSHCKTIVKNKNTRTEANKTFSQTWC